MKINKNLYRHIKKIIIKITKNNKMTKTLTKIKNKTKNIYIKIKTLKILIKAM